MEFLRDIKSEKQSKIEFISLFAFEINTVDVSSHIPGHIPMFT